MFVITSVGFLFLVTSCYAQGIEDASYSIGRFKELDECDSEAKGLDWIISKRKADYGWGPHTHRCITAVFTAMYDNRTTISRVDQELMILQLEVELSLALLGSNLNLPQSELAFYIHALIIVGLNPKNFRSVNLVNILEKKMEEQNLMIHPFSVLCLCNVGVLKKDYLNRIQKYLLTEVGGTTTNFNIEMSAITLQAYLCSVGDFRNEHITSSAEVLAKLQKPDGSFGNIFTTSVVVQALKAIDLYDKQVTKARTFLARQELTNVVDIYYAEMALCRFDFIKDYFIDLPEDLQKDWENKVLVKYTTKIGALPDSYVQLSLQVPRGYTFFDVMKVAAKENSAFKFSNSWIDNDIPTIYSICDVPNNAEDGLHWRLYKRISNDIDENSRLEELTRPVSDFLVRQNEDYIFHYKSIFEQA